MAAQDVLKKLLASKMKGANPKVAQALLAKMKGRGGKPQAQNKNARGFVGSKAIPMPQGGLPQGGKLVAPNPNKPTVVTPQAAIAMTKKRKRR